MQQTANTIYTHYHWKRWEIDIFPRNRSINDLMPLIGARFYTIIDDVFTRGDQIEDELR